MAAAMATLAMRGPIEESQIKENPPSHTWDRY